MNVANETSRAAFFLAFVYESGGTQRQTDHTDGRAVTRFSKYSTNTINNKLYYLLNVNRKYKLNTVFTCYIDKTV